jgi:NAD-dependent SIR2 family protein deacetylase
MKINCLSCGHKVELDDVYEDYAGLIKCYVCGALLELKTEEGRLRSVSLMLRPACPLDEEAVPAAGMETKQ